MSVCRLCLPGEYDEPRPSWSHALQQGTVDYLKLLNRTTGLREFIGGVHLWGKDTSPSGRRIAHCGTLDTFFNGNAEIKQRFLNGVAYVFNDDIPRKMVLEVNSGNDDMLSIINDLRSVGIQFV